jgi:DNA-cytosine methyltransferase
MVNQTTQYGKAKVITYFSGGGIGIAALDKERYEFLLAVEYDAKLASLYKLNYPEGDVLVGRVQNVTEEQLLAKVAYGQLDIFQASPVCKNFSKAKKGAVEGNEELSQAQAVCNVIEWVYPRYVVVENVMAYRTSISFENIVLKLNSSGYKTQWKVINSANYGIPQTRKRLLLVASRNDMPEYIWPAETHHEGPETSSLFNGLIKPWVGWYEAVEDLIPTLPEAKFANWQLKRLPTDITSHFLMRSQNVYQEGKNQTRPIEWPAMTITANERPRALLAAVQGEQSDIFYDDEPAQTITSAHGEAKYRAFLFESKNANQQWGKGYKEETQHSPTVTAYDRPAHQPKALLVGDQRSHNGSKVISRLEEEPCLTIDTRPSGKWKSYLPEGRVVQMTSRALARFQSVPDSYKLSGHNTTNCIAIGNGIPSLIIKILTENMDGLTLKKELELAA